MAHRELDLRERCAIEDMLNAKFPLRKIAADIACITPIRRTLDDP